jgi:hypothetical protein
MLPTDEPLDYDDAMAVLCGWEGRAVLVIAFVEPGVSLHPFMGTLSIDAAKPGVVRASIDNGAQPVRIAFPSGTFHDAWWVPGMEDRGLSVEQGATRVDVFLDD